jgi:hypothetical protein
MTGRLRSPLKKASAWTTMTAAASSIGCSDQANQDAMNAARGATAVTENETAIAIGTAIPTIARS